MANGANPWGARRRNNEADRAPIYTSLKSAMTQGDVPMKASANNLSGVLGQGDKPNKGNAPTVRTLGQVMDQK